MSARRTDLVVVGLVVSAYVLLAVSVVRYNSVTFDEGSHLPSGYMALAYGDYRLNPEHPPLIKLVASVPLLFTDVRVKRDDVTWHMRRQWEFGRHFLYRWNDADRLLLLGRLPMVALAVALGLSVFFWARRLVGRGAAFVALVLCLLGPDLLAHGTLVTTDVGLTLFAFLSVVALERMRDGVTGPRIAALAAALSLAAATKFSVVLFVPILVVLAAVLVRKQGVPARRLVVAALVVAVCAYAFLWTCFRFRFAASLDRIPPLSWDNVVPAAAPLRVAARTALDAHLLPEAFVLGFLRFYKASQDRPSYLFGHLSKEGRWYYFPITFLIKTPIPLIILVLAAVVLARRYADDPVRECFLWIPPLLYTALVMTRSLNIGHRHLLPIYPFLFVLAGRAAAHGLFAGRAWRSCTAALLVWYAGGTVRLHPHYLAFFNELVGGPSNGYRCLLDSNLDWGQDLRGLHDFLQKEGVREFRFSYFGSAVPDYYGLHCERAPGLGQPAPAPAPIRKGDLVAVSATNLGLVYMTGSAQEFMERFRQEKPIASVGYSILIYRARDNYVVPADAMGGMPPVACILN